MLTDVFQLEGRPHDGTDRTGLTVAELQRATVFANPARPLRAVEGVADGITGAHALLHFPTIHLDSAHGRDRPFMVEHSRIRVESGVVLHGRRTILSDEKDVGDVRLVRGVAPLTLKLVPPCFTFH